MMNLSSLSKAAALAIVVAVSGLFVYPLTFLFPAWAETCDLLVTAFAVTAGFGSLWYIWKTRHVLAGVSDVCVRAYRGDLEARILNANEKGELGVLQNNMNNMLDIVDAFVREAAASMDHVANAKYFRTILVRGLPGAFRNTAKVNNTAVECMASKVKEFGSFTSNLVNESEMMIQSIGGAVSKMLTGADALTSAAKSTSEQSVSASASSEEVTVNVQTVSAAAEELSKSIMEISRQLTAVSRVATGAVAEAERSNKTITGLVDAVNKIGDVIALINDIASQTNLLALNATIEAARAGEAGKGFSVVASEVKALANQTAKATEEITGQISAIQTATNEAVTAIQAVGKTIGTINEYSSAIASAVEEQNAATSEIARNVQQAATGTQEVSSNISKIANGANEVTKGAEKTREAADEVGAVSDNLAKRTITLREELDKFLKGCVASEAA